jgi:hypothetical protein
MEDFSGICKGCYMYHQRISKVSKGISRKKMKHVLMKNKFVMRPKYIILSNDSNKNL